MVLRDAGLCVPNTQEIASTTFDLPEPFGPTIEEAAGILPLRIKKEKSLKRIESGEKEIKRAKDVLREIKKQLNPLKEQAEKAKLHQENTDLLKDKSQKLNVLMYKHGDTRKPSLAFHTFPDVSLQIS